MRPAGLRTFLLVRDASQGPCRPLCPWPFPSSHGRRRLVYVSEAHDHDQPITGRSLTLAVARLQRAEPADVDELVDDIWESDEELDAFVADLRASRNASLA